MITEFLEKVNERIENVAKKLKLNLNVAETKFNAAFQRDLKTSKQREKIINSLQRVLDASTANEDINMLAVMDKVQRIYNKLDQDVSEVKKNFRDVDFHMGLEQLFEAFEKSLQCFGYLEINVSMNPEVSVSRLCNVNINKHTEHFTIKGAFITGGVLLPDGNIAVVDNDQSKLQIYDDKGKLKSELIFSHQPWDITCLNSNTVALTIPSQKLIHVISVSDMSSVNTIPTQEECHGIVYYQGKIAVSIPGKILIIDTNGKVERKIHTPIKSIQYLQFENKDKIVCTGGSCMYRIKLDGTVVTHQTHDKELRKMSFDCDGNMYIASDKFYRLDQKEGIFSEVLKFPYKSTLGGRVVAFQRDTNKFLASWDRQNIGTFELKAI